MLFNVSLRIRRRYHCAKSICDPAAKDAYCQLRAKRALSLYKVYFVTCSSKDAYCQLGAKKGVNAFQ